MVDTPTPVYGLRQQSLGSNVNTWGDDKLNDVLVGIAQLIGQIKEITLTGNYTITSTNYVSTADNRNAGWGFVGTLTATATVTVPSSRAVMYVLNATTGGYSVIVKTSAGTGITIPNGRTALLWSDGVNVYNLFPNHMGTDFEPLLSGDAANVQYVETAIANASIPASAGTVLVSGTDTTAGYAGTKVQVTGSGAASVVQTITNPGANEVSSFAVAVGSLGLTDGGLETASFAAAVNTKYRFPAGGTVTLPAATGNGDIIALSPYGLGVTTLSGTINGTTSFVLQGDQTLIITDSDATRGWV